MPTAFRTISEKTTAAVLAADVHEGERVVVVSADFAPAVYGVILLMELHRPLPRTWHIWSMAPLAHTLRRVSEREVELLVRDGRMVQSVFEQNFRNDSHPLRVGEQVQLDGARVTVTQVEEGMPTAITVELQAPLETYRFLWWDGEVLARFSLPEVGQTLELPRGDTMFERLLGAK
jgi:hypothetical protein